MKNKVTSKKSVRTNVKKSAPNRPSAKKRRPISDKAYRDFTGRLTSTLAHELGDQNACDEAIGMLDRYITGTPFEDVTNNASITAVIAFSILRPEIDKAIQRSSNARRRAMLRRESAANAMTQTTPTDEPMISYEEAILKAEKQGVSATPVCLNRRQRREQERQMARMQRKKRLSAV